MRRFAQDRAMSLASALRYATAAALRGASSCPAVVLNSRNNNRSLPQAGD